MRQEYIILDISWKSDHPENLILVSLFFFLLQYFQFFLSFLVLHACAWRWEPSCVKNVFSLILKFHKLSFTERLVNGRSGHLRQGPKWFVDHDDKGLIVQLVVDFPLWQTPVSGSSIVFGAFLPEKKVIYWENAIVEITLCLEIPQREEITFVLFMDEDTKRWGQGDI